MKDIRNLQNEFINSRNLLAACVSKSADQIVLNRVELSTSEERFKNEIIELKSILGLEVYQSDQDNYNQINEMKSEIMAQVEGNYDFTNDFMAIDESVLRMGNCKIDYDDRMKRLMECVSLASKCKTEIDQVFDKEKQYRDLERLSLM